VLGNIGEVEQAYDESCGVMTKFYTITGKKKYINIPPERLEK